MQATLFDGIERASAGRAARQLPGLCSCLSCRTFVFHDQAVHLVEPDPWQWQLLAVHLGGLLGRQRRAALGPGKPTPHVCPHLQLRVGSLLRSRISGSHYRVVGLTPIEATLRFEPGKRSVVVPCRFLFGDYAPLAEGGKGGRPCA